MFNGISMTFNPVLAALMSARIVPSFDPLTLFANGEPGVWYDPSDMTTLFQDAAGTTPVTAVEQPVGLMLDKSKGLVLGSELVTNGGFDADTGWTKDSGVSIGSGVCSFLSVANNSGVYQSGKQVYKNRVYSVTYTLSSISSGSVAIYLCGSKGTTRSIAGTYTEQFAPTTGVDGFIQVLSNSAGTTATIDNISVRELLGNHARQSASSTSRPVLSARYNLLTKTEQFDDVAWVKANVTVAANAVVAPNGETAADFLCPNTSVAQHRLDQTPSSLSGSQTFSVFAKAAGYRWISLRIGGSGRNFDLETGTLGTAGALSGTITAIGNGWYRCSVVAPSALANDVCRINVEPSNSIASDFAGDGTSGIYIWGAQLEQAT